MATITLVFTAHICNGEKMRTHPCPTLRLSTKMGCYDPYHEQVAFNSAPSKAVNPQAGHHWQRELLQGTPTTHAHPCMQTTTLGNQVGKLTAPHMGIQPWRTLSRANCKPGIATSKGATSPRIAIKQGGAFNKTSAKSVTHIKTTRKQGSPTINEVTAIKNVTESGSTSATEVIAHNPWLASDAPSPETNNQHACHSTRT